MEENPSGWDSNMVIVLESLRKRGWCLKDTVDLKAIVVFQSTLAADRFDVVDSVESELLNSDLRSIGAKSLPQLSLHRNSSSFLQGPKVLQISSVRDISNSSVDDFLRNSGGRRLLRLCLTDGHSEITAVEYSHVPSIPNNVVPGTKIRLENKVAVHSGIVCLNPEVLTVLGGVVQSLFEEREMNQKYSGLSRSSLRKLENLDTGGPPSFVKLQVGSSSGIADHNSSRSDKPIAEVGEAKRRPTDIKQDPNQKPNIFDVNIVKASSSGTRPKEVVESVPVQNQAAAQKLLQKLNHPSKSDRHFKGGNHRGKGKEEDPVVFTLEEYENRKAQTRPSDKDNDLDISRDEDLARQLQNQLYLEDSQGRWGGYDAKAQDIRMSMFTFERDFDSSHQMEGGRRGRRRGRGRGRGRGRYGY